VLNQKEVLDALTHHKDKDRYVHQSVDKGEEEAIQSIKRWLTGQAVEEEQQEDGTTKKRMGLEVKDILAKLKSGDASAVKKIK